MLEGKFGGISWNVFVDTRCFYLPIFFCDEKSRLKGQEEKGKNILYSWQSQPLVQNYCKSYQLCDY